jgi:hypothetical protein
MALVPRGNDSFEPSASESVSCSAITAIFAAISSDYQRKRQRKYMVDRLAFPRGSFRLLTHRQECSGQRFTARTYNRGPIISQEFDLSSAIVHFHAA